MTMEFSTTRKEEHVKVDGVQYLLREADEEAARKYRNACTKGVTLDDGKIVKVDGIADVQSYLVSLCLFEVLTDGTTKNVPTILITIRTWPARIVKWMFDWTVETSDLSEKPTADSLRKQIAKLQKQLDDIEKDKGDQAKNLQESATTSLESAPT